MKRPNRTAKLHNVGDVVKIADSVKEIPGEMNNFAGKKAKVVKKLINFYLLDIDNGTYMWTDRILEAPSKNKLFEKFIKGEITESEYKYYILLLNEGAW